MLSYVEARVVRPLIENQTLLILCTTTIAVMMGHGIISPVLPLYAQSFGVGTAMIGLTITVFGAARLRVIFSWGARSNGVIMAGRAKGGCRVKE